MITDRLGLGNPSSSLKLQMALGVAITPTCGGSIPIPPEGGVLIRKGDPGTRSLPIAHYSQ
ncbi:hypothetical protein NG796_08875 [Laspinema sp. A4]|uniref:hypothetical protein n=1 Tax=Laspinema sp. D2d TaxID=2953686 RepID=UPI0021BB8D27|nr:hypothetical protein [Laspinema sp. D2d]MCT7983406.1 hypothetical protein [Laspinema sp. D2d]